jgi:hypothetical protein
MNANSVPTAGRRNAPGVATRRRDHPRQWLLEPETETVEEYALEGRGYGMVSRHGAGESFGPALFPGTSVAVDLLFDTQDKRHGPWEAEEPDEPQGSWLLSPDHRVRLEALFFFGHPERRYEI